MGLEKWRLDSSKLCLFKEMTGSWNEAEEEPTCEEEEYSLGEVVEESLDPAPPGGVCGRERPCMLLVYELELSSLGVSNSKKGLKPDAVPWAGSLGVSSRTGGASLAVEVFRAEPFSLWGSGADIAVVEQRCKLGLVSFGSLEDCKAAEVSNTF